MKSKVVADWINRIKEDKFCRLPVLCIYGEQDTGKSTCINEMVDYFRPQKTVLWNTDTIWTYDLEDAVLVLCYGWLPRRFNYNSEMLTIHQQTYAPRIVRNTTHWIVEHTTWMPGCLNVEFKRTAV